MKSQPNQSKVFLAYVIMLGNVKTYYEIPTLSLKVPQITIVSRFLAKNHRAREVVVGENFILYFLCRKFEFHAHLPVVNKTKRIKIFVKICLT